MEGKRTLIFQPHVLYSGVSVDMLAVSAAVSRFACRNAMLMVALSLTELPNEHE